MSKHTQGPWIAKHVEGSNFAVQTFDIRGMFAGSPGVSPIFNRNRHAIDGTHVHCSPEDARLIAAAPELLAVCEKILADDDQIELLADETVDVLRAAVSKARS